MREDKQKALAEAEQIARRVATGLGLEVVEFVFHSQGRHSQLRIDVDRPGATGVGIADCERMSRALDADLDGLPLFEAPYELQVSSPGIDRPIRSDDDVRRNTGRLVRAEYKDETGKLCDICGILAGLTGSDAVRIVADGGDVTIGRKLIMVMKQEVAPGGRKRNES